MTINPSLVGNMLGVNKVLSQYCFALVHAHQVQRIRNCFALLCFGFKPSHPKPAFCYKTFLEEKESSRSRENRIDPPSPHSPKGSTALPGTPWHRKAPIHEAFSIIDTPLICGCSRPHHRVSFSGFPIFCQRIRGGLCVGASARFRSA